MEGDIRACFDQISHEWLLANVPMDKAILAKWLKAGYLENQVLHPTEEGTPQGGIISPVLANVALNGLEARLREHFPYRSQKSWKAKLNVCRYADDFVITGSSQELLETQIKPIVVDFLAERGLSLSPEKTVITPIEAGFDFLGQTLRKIQGKLGTIPSKRNVKTFLATIRAVVKRQKQAPADELVRLLNPKIRGWANYHRHVQSKAVFGAVDHALTQCLWRWAVRRHRGKPRSWIWRKYFCCQGGNNGIFFGEKGDTEGTSRVFRLIRASSTPIRRHTKIRSDANPYDPSWELYFEERLGVKMESNLRGRRQLSRLWREQGGICPVCQQKITKLTGWHNHHIVWRAHGGSDTSENRVLLHPNCHRQVHATGATVAKPRSVKGR